MRSRILLVFLFLGFIASVKAQTTEDGIKMLDYENYSSARRILSELVKQQPSNPLNYYYLGIAYCNLGKIDSARIVFNAGMLADPRSIYNYVGLGRTQLEQNDAQKATESFAKAKYLTSAKDITQYILIADAYASAAHPNYEMAVTISNQAIQYTNKNYEVYWVLGKANEGLGKSGDAVSAYERATDLNPSLAKAYVRMGVIWRTARNGKLSEENFQKALTADPNFPPAYRELAELYFYTARYDLATQTYQKYLDLADKGNDTQFRYAQFLFVTKKYPEALNILSSLKSQMDVPVMYRLLGYANYETGNYQEGLVNMKIFFERVEVAKIIASDYEYLGKLQIKTGMDSLGFVTIEKAIEKDSTKYALYDTLATYLYKQKKYAESAEYYVRKLKVIPHDAPFKEVANSYYQAGKAYYFGHKYLSADSIFEKVSELSPNWPISYLFRARAQLFIDSLDTARAKAFPFYQMFVSKAYSDSINYKKDLVEAYQYLGNYNAYDRNQNYGAALYYYGKVISLDPANTELGETVKTIKDIYKTSPGNSIPCEKDTFGYLIPVIINGTSIKCLFDPGITGIVVTQEGSTQLGNATKVDILKIGDDSLKNVPITLASEGKRPVSIGADVLNKMNMVFDYASSSVLQR